MMVTEWPFWCVQIEGEYTHKTPTQPYLTNSTNAQAQTHKYASTHPPIPISPRALPLSKFRRVPHAQHHFGLFESIQTSSVPIMTTFENSVLSPKKKHCSLYFLIYEYLIAPHVW